MKLHIATYLCNSKSTTPDLQDEEIFYIFHSVY